MITIKKTDSVKLTAKDISIINDQFADEETGEEVDLVGLCKECVGTSDLNIVISQKSDKDVTPTEE